jgi:hypothetical protein
MSLGRLAVSRTIVGSSHNLSSFVIRSGFHADFGGGFLVAFPVAYTYPLWQIYHKGFLVLFVFKQQCFQLVFVARECATLDWDRLFR